MNIRVSKHSQRSFRAFLLSATALVASGALMAQPALGQTHQFATPGPHSMPIIATIGGVGMSANNGIVATYTGAISYDNNGLLIIGGGSGNTGTLIFAPTVINLGGGQNNLRATGGTMRIGSEIARSFIANSADFSIDSGAILDLNGGDLLLGNFRDQNDTKITNDAVGTAALLTVGDWIRGTLADGAGTLGVRAQGEGGILWGNNTYSGGTVIAGGTSLQANSSTALGTGIVRFEGTGGTLALISGVTLANAVNLAPNATATFVTGNTSRLNGAITAASADADIFKTGFGTLEMGGSVGVNRIFLNQGTLTSAVGANIADTASVNVSAGATFNVLGNEKIYEILGSGRVTIADGASLTLGREPVGGTDFTTTSVNLITGDGQLIKEGGNRQTIRNANNNYSGGTVLRGGTLVAGATNTLGSGTIEIDAADTLLALGDNVRLDNQIVVRSGDLNIAVDTGRATLAGEINGSAFGGAGDFRKSGAGTLVLTGPGSQFNDVWLDSGHLQVDGTMAGAFLTVANATGLSGLGTIEADVIVADGGTLYGRTGQTLTIVDSLTLNDTSIIDVELGAPDATALFDVGGALTLDGRLNITNAGGMGSGIYRLFDYAGALTDNTLDVNAQPGGATATVQTSVANQVNILMAMAGGPAWQFWDGNNTASNNAVDGGTGNWGSLTNWTNAGGASNAAWAGGYAAFQGAAGTVTVAPGGVSVAGMQFVTTGYEINGGPIALSEAQTVIRVGDGTQDGDATRATISSDITGVGALVKDDYGRLILTGNNNYQGDTIIRNGMLIGDTDSIRNNVVNSGRLEFNQVQDGTFAGSITGNSEYSVYKNGAGTLRLTGLNTLDWTH